MYHYIREELIELGCPVRIINGMPDHVHALFLLNPQKSIVDVIKQIKGSSSHSINGENLILEKLLGKLVLQLIPLVNLNWMLFIIILKNRNNII